MLQMFLKLTMAYMMDAKHTWSKLERFRYEAYLSKIHLWTGTAALIDLYT
jgi:hypothetical protein